MPTLDRDARPEEMPPELVDGINTAIDQLRAMLVPTLRLAEPSGYRTANLIRCFVQSYVRRTLNFLDAAIAERDAGRSIVTRACVRSIQETVASFYDFSQELKPLAELLDHEKVSTLAEARAFAPRLPSLLANSDPTLTAKNILTQVDELARVVPEFRSAYDHLSEVVHPNALGTTVYYTSLTSGVASSTDNGSGHGRALDYICTSGVLLVDPQCLVGCHVFYESKFEMTIETSTNLVNCYFSSPDHERSRQ